MKMKWNVIITNALVIISLLVACRSCKIAKDALEISNNQFYQINKPYISAKPLKLKDDTYIEIIKKSKSLILNSKVEVKNAGNVAATNVTLPGNFQLNEEMANKEGSRLTYNNQTQGGVELGPGEILFIDTQLVLNFDDEEILQKEFNEFKQGEPVYIQIPISYESSINKNQKFRLVEEYMINIDSNSIVRSELIMNEEIN